MNPHKIDYIVIAIRPTDETAPILARATEPLLERAIAPAPPSMVATIVFVSLALVGLGAVLAYAARALVWLSAAVQW